MTPGGSESEVRAGRLVWLAFLAVLAWQLAGMWPPAAVEGDGEAIAAGAEALAGQGPASAAGCYLYAGQVGTYALLSGVRSLIGFACSPTFAALSATAAITVVLLAAFLLRSLLAVPFAAAGLALLLFQETAAEGFYPNSTVLAASFFMLACVIAVAGEADWVRAASSGLALAVAGLLRADVVLAAPVLPVLLHRGAAARTVRAAAVCVAAAASAYSAVSLMLGGGPFDAAHEAVAHLGGSASASLELPRWLGHEGVRSAVAFLGPGWVVAIALGVVALARRGRWRLLLVAGLGTVPLTAAYVRNLSSPKYLYLAIPFFVLPALAAFAEPGRRWRRGVAAAVALVALQQLVGVRIAIRTKPWIAPPRDALVLVGREIDNGLVSRVELALGGGTIVPTADGLRLSSGLAFAPLVWHRAKASTRRCQLGLKNLLASDDSVPDELFSGSWLALNTVDLALWEAGFAPVRQVRLPLPYGRKRLWQRGDRTVVHTSCEMYDYDWKPRAQALSHASFPRLVYVAGGGRERATTLAHAAARIMCDDDGPNCIALLELDLPGPLEPSGLAVGQRMAKSRAPGPS